MPDDPDDLAPSAEARAPRHLGELAIQEIRIGSRAVLAASGEIDIATAERICSAVVRAAESGATDLWLDLTDVTFLDSSGMHAIVAAREATYAAGARFLVVCPDGPVLRVLSIAGVDRGMTIYPDRASAHAAG